MTEGEFVNYQFPIDSDWSTEEIIMVVECLAIVEKAHHEKVASQSILQKYQAFKTVIRSMSEEKKIDREFAKDTGYSLYRTIKAAKEKPEKKIKMTSN